MEKLFDPGVEPMRVAIHMSDTGTNAQKIIERYLKQRDEGDVTFEPVLMITDNPDSNAWKIATQMYKHKDFQLTVVCNPVKEFYKQARCDREEDPEVLGEYDMWMSNILNATGVHTIALAGYKHKATPPLFNTYLTLNVLPGDLRVKDEHGKRRYTGFGWVPSAKAILAGEDDLHTSVYQVSYEFAEGPLLAVSAPQKVDKRVAPTWIASYTVSPPMSTLENFSVMALISPSISE